MELKLRLQQDILIRLKPETALQANISAEVKGQESQQTDNRWRKTFLQLIETLEAVLYVLLIICT